VAQASTGPFALRPSGPIHPAAGLMLSDSIAAGFAICGKYFLGCLQEWDRPIPGLVAICSEKNEKKYGSSLHPAQPIEFQQHQPVVGCVTWLAGLAGLPESTLFHELAGLAGLTGSTLFHELAGLAGLTGSTLFHELAGLAGLTGLLQYLLSKSLLLFQEIIRSSLVKNLL
jgi:hypothetical protein